MLGRAGAFCRSPGDRNIAVPAERAEAVANVTLVAVSLYVNIVLAEVSAAHQPHSPCVYVT